MSLMYQFALDAPMFDQVCESQGWKHSTAVAGAMQVPVSTVTRVRNQQVVPSGEFVASFAAVTGFPPGVGFRVERVPGAAAPAEVVAAVQPVG